MTPYKFDDVVKSQTANDIFAIYKNEKGYWLGTSSGLLHLNQDYSHRHDRADLFSNNTVHGILEDQQNNLWISTNQGLVRFNPQTNTGQTYGRENGPKSPNSVTELFIRTYEPEPYSSEVQTAL